MQIACSIVCSDWSIDSWPINDVTEIQGCRGYILRQSATTTGTNQYREKPLSNNWAYSRAGDSVDPAALVFTRVTNTRTATL